MIRRPPSSTRFPSTTLFRSREPVHPGGPRPSRESSPLRHTLDAVRPLHARAVAAARARQDRLTKPRGALGVLEDVAVQLSGLADRKSTRLNSSHANISYAVF